MSDFVFSIRRDGSAQLEEYIGSSPAVIIPGDYEGHPVTVLADNAFSWQSSIRSVVSGFRHIRPFEVKFCKGEFAKVIVFCFPPFLQCHPVSPLYGLSYHE